MGYGSYVLANDGKTPIRCTFDEMIAYEKKRKGEDWRRVALDEFNGVKVSTVFLAFDHSFTNGPPVLWETMIFGGEHGDYQERYSSYDDAVAGHAQAVKLAGGNPGAEGHAVTPSASAAQK